MCIGACDIYHGLVHAYVAYHITKDIWKENAKDDEGIYQGIHADYTHPTQGKLPQDPRIKGYLAITEDILNNFFKLSKAKNVLLCRNPYTLEPPEKLLILVSPTRLTVEKGGTLMLDLANALDSINCRFLWLILTTPEYLSNEIFSNPNVVYVKNRLDVDRFLRLADWVVLPSECEGDSYTIKEALYRGIPIVARHLKYFDEYGIEDNKNALFINKNNVLDVAKRMQHKLTFKFDEIEDGYADILYKSKSTYKEEIYMKVKIKPTQTYYDVVLKRQVDKEEELIFDRERADHLVELGLVEIVDVIKEEPENKKKPTKKVEKKAK